MSSLAIDARIPRLSAESVDAAVRAEEIGYDGVFTPEMDNDPFLPLPVIADRTDDLTLGTRIALAFTRSPTTIAYTAWELARYANGRFVLGLGTQVKAHNERRFGVEWSAPGPRLREVVEALRHLFEVFQGETDLDYDGEHYQLSLMTENFNPGPIDHPDVPIWIAGVNDFNLKLAGELCDGLAMHPFNTPEYTEDVIAPTVAEGADLDDRSLDDVALSARPFVVTGETPEEREEAREHVRSRIAFYGSTPTYSGVLEHHGWRSVGEELHELSREQRWDEMAELVTDEMVATFAVEAEPGELLAAVEDAYGDVADRAMLPLDHGAAIMGK